MLSLFPTELSDLSFTTYWTVPVSGALLYVWAFYCQHLNDIYCLNAQKPINMVNIVARMLKLL